MISTYQSTARNLTAEVMQQVLNRAAADAAGQQKEVVSRKIVESGDSPNRRFGLEVMFADGQVYRFGDFPRAA